MAYQPDGLLASEARIEKVWGANEEFWNSRIIPEVLVPLEEKGGLPISGAWQHIVAVAFGRTQKTFEAVQLLANPTRPRRLWDDAFILTRVHYETYVTLEWIRLDSETRAQLLLDEYHLKEAHFLDELGGEAKGISRERRAEIFLARDTVLKRHVKGPGTLHLLPSLEARVTEIAVPLKPDHPHLEWEYKVYYRDVSGFAHPSGWGVRLSLAEDSGGDTAVEASVRNGYNAVICNGLWYFRVLHCWNAVFNQISDRVVSDWGKEWATMAGIR